MINARQELIDEAFRLDTMAAEFERSAAAAVPGAPHAMLSAIRAQDLRDEAKRIRARAAELAAATIDTRS